MGRKDDDLGASRLKALIIGCGNIAGGYDLRGSKREVWTHAKAYQQNPGIDLIGVIDSSAQVARKFARTWDVPYSGTQLIPALKAGEDSTKTPRARNEGARVLFPERPGARRLYR